MKIVWYLEAATCGARAWLLLVVGLMLQQAMIDVGYLLTFYMFVVTAAAFILFYTYDGLCRQRDDMWDLLERIFGYESAERLAIWHAMIAAGSVILMISDVCVAVYCKEGLGDVALNIGLCVPLLFGLAGVLLKFIERAFVRWMPDPDGVGTIRLQLRRK